MKPFKPLLADPIDLAEVDWTNLWGSPKIDGFRALIRGGVVMTRNLTPMKNKHAQHLFGNRPEIEHYDGEMIVGDPTDPDVYAKTQSALKKESGEPDVYFHVFDHVGDPTLEYFRRLELVREQERVFKVAQYPITSLEELLAFDDRMLKMGFEGTMYRAFQGPRSMYKFGRSTAKEGTLLKMKHKDTDVARIIGFEEEMHNTNEAVRDEVGRLKRSTAAEGMVGKNTLGKLHCVELKTGTPFFVAGFTDKFADEVWANRPAFENRFIEFEHFPIGRKDAPRNPVFKRMLANDDPLIAQAAPF